MKGKTIGLWILKLISAAILFGTSWAKLSGKPISVQIFTELGMEPTGRYIIGVIELLAALFLLTNRLAATGGLLAMGTMLGAIIAHVSILGFEVDGDHGRHILMLITVLTTSILVTISRRQDLPIIGKSFAE